MANIDSTNSIFNGSGIGLTTTDQYVTIQTGGFVIGAGTIADGLHASNANAIIQIFGTLMGLGTSSSYGDGIYKSSGAAYIYLAESGVLHGVSNAIQINVGATATVFNRGNISNGSTVAAINYLSNSDGLITNVDTGRIASETGKAIEYGGTGIHTLLNFGTIVSGTNTAAVVSIGTGVEKITNTGLIKGGLELGAGDDVVNTRNGRIVTSAVNDVDLGAGLDTYFGSNLSSEIINGGAGNDKLFGGKGNDTISGGLDSDTIVGEGGADFMSGGSGTNTFVYYAITDSGKTAAAADTLSLFDTFGNDRIDLRRIDAIAGGADNAFTFIGAAAFTAAGQVRVAGGQVQLNTIGTTGAEMIIVLQQSSSVDLNDFLL